MRRCAIESDDDDEIDYDDYYDQLKLTEDQSGARELQPANRMYKDTTKKEKGVYKKNENEQDYFSVEFYAETYARNAGIKLVNSPCSEHNECGSKCCVPADSDPSSPNTFCQIREDLTNKDNA